MTTTAPALPIRAQVFLNLNLSFRGWQPGDPLHHVGHLDIDARYAAEGPDAIAEIVFAALNDHPTPALREQVAAYRAARHRSLSVGDVVGLGDTAYAVASFGFEQITAPLTVEQRSDFTRSTR